jgi:ribulose-phosphate 3-epimerase
MTGVAVTILATDPTDFAARIKRIQGFAKRIHVDIADGQFTPTKSIGLAQAYGVPGAQLDLHLMINHPEAQIDNALALKPDLIIVHAEAEGDVRGVLEQCHTLGIKAGLAILPQTPVDAIKDLLPLADHLLIFTGNLGHNGGVMQTKCLDKITEIKRQSKAEIGVDGGVNLETGKLAVEADADVLDTGSFVHNAANPQKAYEELEAL